MDGVIYIFDDVTVYSNSWEEHISTLTHVLSICKANGLKTMLKYRNNSKLLKTI